MPSQTTAKQSRPWLLRLEDPQVSRGRRVDPAEAVEGGAVRQGRRGAPGPAFGAGRIQAPYEALLREVVPPVVVLPAVERRTAEQQHIAAGRGQQRAWFGGAAVRPDHP